MFYSILETPIGKLVIRADELAVNFIGFPETDPIENPSDLTELAKLQFEEYFKGNKIEFNFPYLQTGTDFQQSVWKELLNIPAGKPISYSALSHKMKNPLAIRAIASANGKNNLMILIPCHRVIGSNGDLVGYAGGLWRKKWLLDHESMMTKTGQASLIF